MNGQQRARKLPLFPLFEVDPAEIKAHFQNIEGKLTMYFSRTKQLSVKNTTLLDKVLAPRPCATSKGLLIVNFTLVHVDMKSCEYRNESHTICYLTFEV